MRSAQAGAPARFARQDHFPQGWQPCIGQFVELFHRYGYIYKSLSGGSWYSSNEKWKLPDSEILKAIACVHPRSFIGCRSGKSSRFAVLDIDQSSQYHNQRSLDKLLKVLSEAGLGRSSLYRSSYSGGWHLYLFFDEPINSADLRRQLVRLLALNGFKIEKGQLEIFPSPGSGESLGHGLRLPLQPGFAWLDKKTLEVEHERHELNATQALELFVDALDGDNNSYADFRRLKNHVQELEQSKNVVVEFGNNSADNVVLLKRAEKASATGEFIDFVRGVFKRLDGWREEWQLDDWTKQKTVQVIEDSDGLEAKRFDARTSGQTFLFAPNGTLLFHGGITAARGVTGENEGFNNLSKALARDKTAEAQNPNFKKSLVFGCNLLNERN